MIVRDNVWRLAFTMAAVIPVVLVYSRALADIFASGIGMLFLLRSWRAGDWSWVRDPFVALALAAWIWLLGVSSLAADIPRAYALALPWGRYVLLFIALREWVLKDGVAVQWLVRVATIFLAYVVVDTLWQYATGVSLSGYPIADGNRLTGPIGDPKVGIFLAKLTLPIFIVGWSFAAIRQNARLECVGYVLISVLAVIAVLLSGERVAFASLALGLCTAGSVMAVGDSRWRVPFVAGITGFFVVVVTAFVYVPSVHERFHQLFEIFTQFDDSPYGQLLSASKIIAMDHLWFGAGPGGFRALCPALLAAGTVTYCDLHTHNPYLEWWVEAGVPGLIVFAMMVLCLVRTGYRRVRTRQGMERFFSAVFLAVCAVQFFPLMSTQSYMSNWPGILAWYGLGIAAAAMNARDATRSRRL